MRDPDGYLIEVGQYTEMALDWFDNRSYLASDQQSEFPRSDYVSMRSTH